MICFTLFHARIPAPIPRELFSSGLCSPVGGEFAEVDGEKYIVAKSPTYVNWIQTVPGKGWFAALRFYGPGILNGTWIFPDAMVIEQR